MFHFHALMREPSLAAGTENLPVPAAKCNRGLLSAFFFVKVATKGTFVAYTGRARPQQTARFRQGLARASMVSENGHASKKSVVVVGAGIIGTFLSAS